MATIARVQAIWTGTTGLPGVSTFYWDFTVEPDISDLTAFFTALVTLIPNDVNVDVQNTGDTIDDATGTLNGGWIATGGGTVNMTGTGGHAAGVGVRTQWNTVGIRNGRRVRGATFLAPLTTACFADDGTISTTQLGTIRTAATALADTGALLVWSRPSSPGGSDGDSFAVSSATVPDRVTALRSRRY